jgi:hypothetical protein
MERLTESDWKERFDLKELHPRYKKLAEYEDAEEQGLLKRLPCPEKTECYRIVKRNYGGNFIRKISFKLTDLYDFGKTVFLTREAAEKALEEGVKTDE